MIHRKKIWVEFFDDVESGKKPFEVRVEDESKPIEPPFTPGDTLHLCEWDKEKEVFTGRETKKTISYVLRGWSSLPARTVVLGLENIFEEANLAMIADNYLYWFQKDIRDQAGEEAFQDAFNDLIEALKKIRRSHVREH